MSKSFMYCFFCEPRKGTYSGIVMADNLDEAIEKLSIRKGDIIYPGTLMVKQLDDQVPVPSRMGCARGGAQ